MRAIRRSGIWRAFAAAWLAMASLGPASTARAQGWESDPVDPKGHSAEVVAVSAVDMTVATAGLDGLAKVWDLTNVDKRTLLAHRVDLAGHVGPVLAVALSPDGKLAATGGADRTVRLWDAAGGAPLATLQGHSGAVEALAFSPDGKLVASGGLDTSIRLWDVGARALWRTFEGHEQGVRDLAFRPDGKTLASAARDRTVRLWDVAGGAEPRTLGHHDAPAWSVAFSPDGQLVASGGLDRMVRIWKVEPADPPRAVDAAQGEAAARFAQLADEQRRVMAGRMEELQTRGPGIPLIRQVEPALPLQPGLQGQPQPNQFQAWPAGADVLDLRFSPGSPHLAAALSNLADGPTAPGSVRFFILPGASQPTPMTRPNVRGHLGPIRGVAFAPYSNAIVTVGGDASVRVWGVSTGNLMSASIGRTGPKEVGRRVMAHLDPVEALAISPDARLVATAAGPSGVVLWDPEARSPVGRLVEPSGAARAVAISPDGKTLASGGDDRVVTLRDLATGRPIGILKGHLDAVTCLAFRPDGKLLASGSKDASATLWGVARMDEVATLARHTSAVTALAFRPDGSTLATASLDDTVKLWEVRSGRLLETLDAHKDAVDALAFSPDGSTLASGDRSGMVRTWDAAGWSERRAIRASDAPVRALAFAPDGRTLVEGGDDRAIRRLDVESGQVVARLPGAHAGPVLALAFGPGGIVLASGGADRELKSWDVAARLAPRAFANLDGKVGQMALSPDGRTLATASSDQLVRTWDVATGREVAPPILHPVPDVRLAFSPDGRSLATLAVQVNGAAPQVRDVATGRVQSQAGSRAGSGNSVAFTPDGKSWATVDGPTVHLWSVANGRQVLDFARAGGRVRSMAFSPDGKALAAGLFGGSVAIWDRASPDDPPRTFPHSSLPIDVLAYSPDGRSIAIGGPDRTVRVLDAATGSARLTLRGPRRPITGVAFSPDGKLVASAADGEPVLFAWDAVSGEVASNPTLLDASTGEGFACLAFSPDGRSLYAGGERGVTTFDLREGHRPSPQVARLASKPSGPPRATLTGHASGVVALAFAGGGSKLVTRSEDGVVKAWDLLDGNNRAIRTFGEPDFKAQAMALRPDGRSLAVALRLPDNRLRAQGQGNGLVEPEAPRGARVTAQKMADEVQVWDLETGESRGMISSQSTNAGVDRVVSLAYSADGLSLATASRKGRARTWDAGTLKPGRPLATRPGPAEVVQFTADGRTLVGVDASGLVTLWDVESGNIRGRFAHEGGINRMVLSPDGKLVATAGGRVPPPRSNLARVTIEGVESPATPTQAHPPAPPDPGPGSGGDVRLWDLATGRRVAVLPMGSSRVMRLAFSPDGRSLAASTTAALATVWDVANGSPVVTLAWPSGEARALAFSPDGQALAIGGDDETLRVWDVPAGTLRVDLPGHADAINALAFAPDGRTIATAGRDATVKLWDVPPGP